MPTDLFHASFGRPTDPAIIFVHGGPGANSWGFEKSSVARLVRRNYHVIVYDQRGCGRNTAKLKLAEPVPWAQHRSAPADPNDFTIPKAAQDLHDLIGSYDDDVFPLQSPILVGHSWGGFLSLNYLDLHRAETKIKGLVMVSVPIDYPTSFYTILSNAYEKYDFARRLLFMSHFSILTEIDKLKERMFRRSSGVKPAWSNAERQPFNFDGDDVKEVFRHASMLEFASPEALVLNPGYRRLLDRLSSLEGNELLLRVDEKVSAQLFHNECGRTDDNKCVLDRNNIDLLKEVSERYPVHAIYGRDDKMFSKSQVRKIRDVLSPDCFSYLSNSGHYPFIDQSDEFTEALCKHLSRIRKDI